MCSIVISPFSHDFTTMEIDLLKYQQYFIIVNNYLYVHTCIQHSHSTWFKYQRLMYFVMLHALGIKQGKS